MARVSRNVAVYLCVVLCCLFIAGVGMPSGAKAKAEEQSTPPVAKEKLMKAIVKAQPKVKAVDPYKDARIMVEAFVVDVDLHELYEMGVCPLGSKPNAVSVDHILKCLREGKGAEVTAGAKMLVRQNERGTVRQSVNTTEIVGNRRMTRSNSPERTFEARVVVLQNEEISLEYSFNMVTMSESEEGSKSTTSSFSWSSDACLEAGKPQIAGAIQEGTKAVFLILTADIGSR